MHLLKSFQGRGKEARCIRSGRGRTFLRKLEQAKSELKDEINKVDKRLEQVKSELKTDIANVKADLIKWMFIFWAGQVITITGILIAFLKK